MTAPTIIPIFEAFSVSHAQVLDGATSFLDAVQAVTTPEWDIYGVNDASINPNTDSWDNEGDNTIKSTWDWLNYAELAVQAGYFSFPLISTLTGETISTTGQETQAVTITGAPTGGTFTLTYAGQTTTGIAYNATAAAVRTALEALSNLDAGDVTVSGSAGGPYTVTFTSGADVAQMTASATGLTGGTTPAVTVTTAADGGNGRSWAINLWTGKSMNIGRKPMLVQMPAKTSQGAVAQAVIGLFTVSFAPITFDGPSYKEGLKINYNGKALMSDYDELGVPFADGDPKVAQLIATVGI